MAHQANFRLFSIALLTLALGLLGSVGPLGCAAGMGDGYSDGPAPAIFGLGSDRVAVGEPLRLLGEDLPGIDLGWVDVTFAGDFIPADGTERLAVDLTVALAADEEGNVVWDAFGAHRVPFGRGHQLGTFEGWVYGTVRYYDGAAVTQDPDTWALVSLEVKPSVVVTDFRAVGDTWVADCAEPSVNAINGIPYGLRVKALGFTPVEARFRITEGLLIDGEVTRETTEVRATMEEDDAAILLRFAAVPQHTDGFAVGVAIELVDETGGVHQIDYPVTVRRAMQIYFGRAMELAELYEPVPVSGCIPGGAAGVASTYSESHSETRTRSVAHTVSRDWTRTYGEQHTETYGTAGSMGGSEAAASSVTVTDMSTEGGSETVTDMFSDSTTRTRTTSIDFNEASTDSYGWSVNSEVFGEVNGSVTVGASGGIPLGVLEVKGEATAGFVVGGRRGSGETGGTSRTSGISAGSTDTASSTSTESQSRAAGSHWARSQTYAESNSFTRTDTWNTTKSFSEASTQSHSIAMSLGESDTETFSVSTTDAEALHTTSEVFAGQFGMWFRQTTRLARRGTIVAYDLCGNGSAVGDVNLNDWTWAPDLAIATTCPPEPNFPEAECRISPCEGGAR